MDKANRLELLFSLIAIRWLRWLFPVGNNKRANNPYIESLGLFGLFCLFLGLGPAKSLQSVGSVVMIVALLLSWRVAWPRLRRDPLAIAVGLWTVYVFSNAALTGLAHPELAMEQWEYARRLSRILLIVVIAYWLGSSPRAFCSAAGLAVLSLVVAVLHDTGWSFAQLLASQESRQHYVRNAQDYALFASVLICGFVIFGKRIVVATWNRSHFLCAMGVMLWLVLLIFLVSTFTTAGVRAQWLALGLIAIIAMAAIVWNAIRGKYRLLHAFLAVSFIIVAGTMYSWSQWDRLTERWAPEKDVYAQLLQGEFRDVRTSSVGHRIHLWRGAVVAIKEKPLWGWGPAGTEQAIASADIPEITRQSFGHFHNSYLDMTIRTGLVGAVMLGVIFSIIAWSLWRAYSREVIPADLALFYLCTVIALATGNMFESFVRFQFGWMFIGASLGLIYRHQLDSKKGNL